MCFDFVYSIKFYICKSTNFEVFSNCVFSNIISEAQKEVKDIAEQAFGRKTMEKNGKVQMGAGDFDQGQKNAGKVDESKFFFNPLDPIGNFNRGMNVYCKWGNNNF